MYECTHQFGTQAESHQSCDHNSQAAVNGFSEPWYFSEMELEPVAGCSWAGFRIQTEQPSGTGHACSA